MKISSDNAGSTWIFFGVLIAVGGIFAPFALGSFPIGVFMVTGGIIMVYVGKWMKK